MLHTFRRFIGAAQRRIGLGLSGSTSTFLRSDGTEDIPSGASGGEDLNRHVWSFLSEISTGTTFTSFNLVVAMSSGGGRSSAQDATGAWQSHDTAASIDSWSGHVTGGFHLTKRSHDPHFVARTKSPASNMDSLRLWTGLTTAQLTGADPGGSIIGFRFIPGTDTNFMCATRDGTTLTLGDSGVTPATDTEYVLKFECDQSAGNIKFYINGSLVHTANTTMPALNTVIGAAFYIQTTVNAVRSWKMSSLKGSHLY